MSVLRHPRQEQFDGKSTMRIYLNVRPFGRGWPTKVTKNHEWLVHGRGTNPTGPLRGTPMSFLRHRSRVEDGAQGRKETTNAFGTKSWNLGIVNQERIQKQVPRKATVLLKKNRSVSTSCPPHTLKSPSPPTTIIQRN